MHKDESLVSVVDFFLTELSSGNIQNVTISAADKC